MATTMQEIGDAELKRREGDLSVPRQAFPARLASVPDTSPRVGEPQLRCSFMLSIVLDL